MQRDLQLIQMHFNRPPEIVPKHRY